MIRLTEKQLSEWSFDLDAEEEDFNSSRAMLVKQSQKEAFGKPNITQN